MRRRNLSDDSGATLIIALIFITVVSIVVAVVLSFVDTSMRTTVAVRGEAATAAAADGAAQLAINNLRLGPYKGSEGCAGLGPTVDNVYEQAGTKYSATVTCAVDTADSTAGGSGGVLAINDKNRPGQAVLTLGGPTEDGGFDVKLGGGSVLKVHGNIQSDSYINVQKNLTTDGSGSVTAVSGCVGTIAPAANCAGTRVDDPNYKDPPAPPALATLPKCPTTGNVMQFTPGLYKSRSALNDLMLGDDGSRKGCAGVIIQFTPGRYYFDLDDTGEWLIPAGYLIGGELVDPQLGQPGHAASVPGACKTPIPPDDPAGRAAWTAPANGGVEFVLGGNTHITLDKNSNVELCGTYATDSPPITLYGLKHTIGTGTLTVRAQASTDCVRKSIANGGCAVIDANKHPDTALFIQGTTYTPLDYVNVDLNNRAGQQFRYGIIARKLQLTATGSSDLSQAVIEVPDFVFVNPPLTVLYLTVCVYPGSTGGLPCTKPQLKVKVGIADPDATVQPGKRQVTIYNWSVQRG
jgi:hypothetical protein